MRAKVHYFINQNTVKLQIEARFLSV